MRTPMRPLIYLFLALTLAACTSRTESPHGTILAEVGDEIITVEEFVLNYEFGHAHLRAGEDPRRTYLNYMIYEAVLAQEAAKMNLDTLPSIQHAMHTLEEELLIEQVFNEKVLSNIEVTNEEIRAEINKMAVSFQFRFMPATSRQDAEQLYADIARDGYEAVLEARKEQIPELSQVEGQMTSPYLKADEIDPELLDIIKDLELNMPSQPTFYRGAWYIFEVNDIRRVRLAPEDYENKSSSYEKIIYNKKAVEEGGRFVASTMEPLGVTTKREGFNRLEPILWDWYTEDTPERNLLYYIDEAGLNTPYTEALVAEYDTPLVQFDGQTWTVKDFLEHFTPGRYIMPIKERQQFTMRVADVIALVVRDMILLDLAAEEQFYQIPSYQRNMRQWKNSWMAAEYRNLLRSDTSRTWTAEAFVAHAKEKAEKYPVNVRWNVLDTLDVSTNPAVIGQTVNLLKSNSNKSPFPVVAPDWRVAR